jgi:hypothetical protein
MLPKKKIDRDKAATPTTFRSMIARLKEASEEGKDRHGVK